MNKPTTKPAPPAPLTPGSMAFTAWCAQGTGTGKWHLDHRAPCASFDLSTEAGQRACFHWTNLRPMWSLDNIRKGARLEKHEHTELHLPC